MILGESVLLILCVGLKKKTNIALTYYVIIVSWLVGVILKKILYFKLNYLV